MNKIVRNMETNIVASFSSLNNNIIPNTWFLKWLTANKDIVKSINTVLKLFSNNYFKALHTTKKW